MLVFKYIIGYDHAGEITTNSAKADVGNTAIETMMTYTPFVNASILFFCIAAIRVC
jgi:hypothetical protein